MQSVPITTNVVSSNPVHGEVYSIQHYVINFVSDLWQVSGFLKVLRFHPPKKLTPQYNWNIVKVALNTINQTKPNQTKPNQTKPPLEKIHKTFYIPPVKEDNNDSTSILSYLEDEVKTSGILWILSPLQWKIIIFFL